ncbi:MAG: hypothetical protein M0R51_14260 [Clostridia bacterium]|jgi:hypothetical protein|nr:hypothetical protein [Clostridia bacterium]
MINFLMPLAVLMTSLPAEVPEEISTIWNYDVLGYGTVGSIALFIGGFAFTLWKAKVQRKIVASGLDKTKLIEDTHHTEFVNYKTKAEMEISEMRDDLITLAKTSVRKEAKEIADKWEKRAKKEKVEEVLANAIPIVEKVVEVVKKKKFR